MYPINPAKLKIIMEFEDTTFIFDKVLYYDIESDVTIGHHEYPEMRVKLDFGLHLINYSEVKKESE